MKPTHVLKTLDGGQYLLDLSSPGDHAAMLQIMNRETGMAKVAHLIEDTSRYDQTAYHERNAIILCRQLVALEEV